MEWYLVQFGRGSPVLAVRYADLIEAQEETLRQIFSYCGLALNSLQLGLRAYGRDSQEGTLLARENSREGNKRMLNEAQLRSVTAILQRHPVLNISDFNVPGTLQISGDK
ncbi:MAG TPA: hypothetical protein VFC02_22490 [Anaerolineales bacterium]|nr:hypothetical protein [Anaerolineales bacterium]